MASTVPGDSCGNPGCSYHAHPIRAMYRCILCDVYLHPPAFNPKLEGVCSIFSPSEEDKIQCNSDTCWGTKQSVPPAADPESGASSVASSFAPEDETIDEEDSLRAMTPSAAADKKQKLKRNMDIYDYEAPWEDSKGVSIFCSKAETKDALWELAKASYGGTIFNGVGWHKKKPYTNAYGITRTVYRCPFEYQSKCPFQLCTKLNTAGCRIFVAYYEHDHSKYYKSRGTDLSFKLKAIDSPSKLRKGKFNLVRETMESSNITLTQAQQSSAHRALLYQAKKFTTATLGGNLPSQVGSLKHQFEKYKRDGTDQFHSVYLVGNDYVCNTDGVGEDHMISAVFSTDNLLCNAVRQLMTGVGMTIAIDASHRYNFQGYPVIPIKVVDFSQKAHAVAWAITSKEDKQAHEFILRMLQKGVTNVGRRWAKGDLRIVDREDDLLFPEPVDNFCYKPFSTVTLIKDSAPAAYHAASAVFQECLDGESEPDIIDGVCCTHASLRWISNNKKLFKKQANTKLFMADINDVIKNVPHENMAAIAKKLFGQKWNAAGEGAAVRKWLKSWGSAKISRAQVNTAAVNPLRGGIPADNNALEATNNQDKAMIGRTKEHVPLLIDTWAKKVVRASSKTDTAYHSKMKYRSGHTRNKAVLNGAFFRRCYRMANRKSNYGVILFEVTYDFASQANGVPPQSFLVLSEMGLKNIMDADDFEEEEPTTRHVARYIKNTPYVDWFKDMVKKGSDFLELVDDFDWDEFVAFGFMFHIMMPVPGNPTKQGDTFENHALKHYIHFLNKSGIPTISAEELIARGHNKCWHACTCEKYMHYLLCEHTYVYAFNVKIITGWPKGNLDPTVLPIVSKRKGIRGGDALNKGG